jgi:branched-chain amino acid aminotransferase
MPAEEAQVSVFDSGFMQGVGLFETMRAYSGRVFRTGPHIERLTRSAQALGWTAVPDVEQLHDALVQVMRPLAGQDARVRLTVTTGSLRPSESDTPRLTIVASAAPGGKYPDENYTRGVTLALARWRQSRHDPTAGHKTTSYFGRLAALREAYARGAAEALWLNQDEQVAEGAISSLFIVADGALRTPPLDTPVLPGITRAAVIELAQQQGILVQEAALTLAQVQAADEVFLTNSMMEVMPVVRIERDPIGHEKPGDLTRRLAIAYGELIDREAGA